MNRRLLFAALVVALTQSYVFADLPWQAPGCSKRLLLVPSGVVAGKGGAPAVVDLRAAGGIAPASVRLFAIRRDGKATGPLPAQFSPDRCELLLQPQAGAPLAYAVYFNTGQSKPAVRILPKGQDYVVTGVDYTATIDGVHGHLRSLKFTGGKQPVETLGQGIHWLFRRADNTMIWQREAKPRRIEVVEEGDVRNVVRVTYDDPLAAGNTLTTTYAFYPRHIEVEHHYAVRNPTTTKWVKFFCTLAGVGTRPGFKSDSKAQDLPLLTEGKNKWQCDRWRDVSYADGFGLAAVSLEGRAPVWNMDSTKPNEHETLYIEPLGWGKVKPVDKDIRVRVAYIPHGPGRGHADMVAHFFDASTFPVSAVQAKGGPAIDTDNDSAPDLDELKRGWDPFAADMDLDGLPDGRDPETLRAAKLLQPFKFETNEPAGREPAPTAKDLPDCRIATVGGVPTLVADGKPIGPYTYTGPQDPEQWARLSDAGFRVFFVMMSLREPRKNRFQYQRIDRAAHKLLQAAPDALVIFRIYLPPTAKFGREHPGECLAWEGGAHAPYKDDHYLDRNLGKYSFASDVWREQAADALESFARHVTASDYRRHIAGYFVTGGGTGEWYNWPRPKWLIDFSRAMERAFRRWLQRHYAGDVTKLRAAWRDPSVSFASAKVPDRIERSVKEFGDFLSPASNRRTIDYLRCHSDVLQGKLIYFSRVLKEVSGGRSLVGFFYGYLQCMDFILGGQSSFKEMLRCPTVDFWTTPPPYENRGVGDHAPYRFPVCSVTRHGKLWISEDDIRTHSSGQGNIRYGGTATVEEACEGLKRSFGQVLARGVNAYWFEMGKGWYDHPMILKLFTAMQQIGQATVTVDKRSRSDIAVVVHQESLWVAPQSVTFNLIDRFRIHELCRIGAPYDYWEMADLLALSDDELAGYKLVIFLNAFNLSDAERHLIEQRLKRGGRHLVWFYAPGLIRWPVGASLANMKELTGFGFEFVPGRQSQEVVTTGAGNMPKGDRLGVYERPRTTGFDIDDKRTPKPIPPATTDGVFAVADADATVLGAFKANGKPGFALKRMGDWTSIYAGTLGMPSNVLRALAKLAGCHLYDTDDDIIYASRHFLTIHTMRAGMRHVALPEPCDVYDLFERRTVAKRVTAFDVDIPAKSTRLYYLGNAADIDARLKKATTQAAARLKRIAQMRSKVEKKLEQTKPTRAKGAGPFALDRDGFVTDFLLCGPFPNPATPRDKGMNTDYLKGEASCRPANATGGFVGWHSPSPVVYIAAKDFGFATDQQICYYVCCYVDVPSAQKISVNIGSDDGYRLWFDGKVLGTIVTSRGVEVDSNMHAVDAASGRHCILLKVEQGGGPTGFCIRVTDAEGKALKRAKVWLKP